MTQTPEDFLRFLEEQRGEYGRGVPAKVSEMERLAAGIGTDPTVELAVLERLAHSMAGAGGTFGFEELGTAAKALERSVQRLRESGEAATAAQREEILGAIRHLKTKLPRA
jgi:HPt (histidine-containing phosphotransfer) domain-containing protein